MKTRPGNEAPVRQRVNLTIRADVIAAAKELGLNASKAAEAGIAEAVRSAREAEWRRDNKAAIDAHNDRVGRDGPAIIAEWTRSAWKSNGAI